MLIFLFLVVVAKAATATAATLMSVAVVGLAVIMFFYLLKHYLVTLTRLLLVLVATAPGVMGLLAVQVFLIRLLRLVVEEDMGAEIRTVVDAVESTRFMGLVNRRTLLMSLGPSVVVVEQDLPLMVQMPQVPNRGRNSAALADLVIICGV
jgi:hypothetical protein